MVLKRLLSCFSRIGHKSNPTNGKWKWHCKSSQTAQLNSKQEVSSLVSFRFICDCSLFRKFRVVKSLLIPKVLWSMVADFLPVQELVYLTSNPICRASNLGISCNLYKRTTKFRLMQDFRVKKLKFCRNALKYKSWASLQWMLTGIDLKNESKFCIRETQDILQGMADSVAVEGNKTYLEWIFQYSRGERKYLNKIPDRYCSECAKIMNNEDDDEFYDKAGQDWNPFCNTTIKAAEHGQLEILQWLYKNGYPLSVDVCSQAAKNGHFLLLQWAKEQKCPWDSRTSISAAEGGHFEMLKWAVLHGCPWNGFTTSGAARSKNLEILKWLRSQKPPCPWSASTCAAAAERGQISMLEWARSQPEPCPWNEDACNLAAKEGHLETLKWLTSQPEPCPWSQQTCINALNNNYVAVAQWLIENGCPYDTHKIPIIAAKKGNLEFLKLLHSRHQILFDTATCLAAALEYQWEVLKWLRSLTPLIPLNSEICAAAAYHGSLETLQWLRAEDCPWDMQTTTHAAGHGHFDIFVWAVNNECPITDDLCCDLTHRAFRSNDKIDIARRKLGIQRILKYLQKKNQVCFYCDKKLFSEG